jgi:large subunit ribosomal protein L23
MTQISVIPRATEKAYAQSQNNVYVFNVPLDANKQQIVAAVEAQFEVKVERIKTLVQTGKAVRFSRGKRAQPGKTTRKDAKKAYVTLAEGSHIQVFDQPTEEKKEKK